MDEQMSGGEEGQWLGWLGRSVNSRQKPDPIKRAWGSSHSSQKGLPLFSFEACSWPRGDRESPQLSYSSLISPLDPGEV